LNASVLEDVWGESSNISNKVTVIAHGKYLALEVFEHYCSSSDTAQAEEDLEYFSYNAISSLRNLKISVKLIWGDPNSYSGILVRNNTKGNYAFKKEALQRLLDTGLHPVWFRIGKKNNFPQAANDLLSALPKGRKWCAFLSPFVEKSDE
jgi:hypothetical protein